MKIGLEVLLANRSKSKILGKSYGLLVHPASVDSKFRHASECLSGAGLKSLFGPQHGAKGDKQDNMIESDNFRDPILNVPVYSLYGKSREPEAYMVKDLETLVIDLQDVGARYFTYIYTMANCMKVAKKNGIRIIVLDRPNPISGEIVDGNVLHPGYESFVGFYPIAVQHGMTIGELALLFNSEFEIGCDLKIISMTGWKRKMWFNETNLPWVNPSPNLPNLDGCIVYPGMCLFEATQVSEGRGTTRPFEYVGAPYIDPNELVSRLKSEKLQGCTLRPTYFQPTSNKFKDELCGGLQIHITDRKKYKSFLTAVAILKSIVELYPNEFKWKQPPYEYEYVKLPIDILAGGDTLRKQIESFASLREIESTYHSDLEKFKKIRKNYLLYR